MDRKQFLSTLLVLPAGIFLVHCSSDSDSSSTTPGASGASNGGASNGGASNGGAANSADPPAAAPTNDGTQTTYTSSTTSSHSHTFLIEDTSFSAPPADGVNGDSGVAGGHTHTVLVTMAQLAQVAAGDSVTVTSGSTGNHTHVFTFVKVA